MRHVQQGRRFYVLLHAVPGRTALPAAPQHFVMQDAMAAGVYPGQDGCMAGISKRREHGIYIFHQRAFPQQSAKMRQRFHVGDIGCAQRIDTEHQKFRHVIFPSLSTRDLSEYKFGTVSVRVACHGWAEGVPGCRNGME